MSKEMNLTPRQAARRLGVSLHHVYELLWTEKLAARRVQGRWLISSQVIEARRRERKSGNATIRS